jgi:hypothetical protein
VGGLRVKENSIHGLGNERRIGRLRNAFGVGGSQSPCIVDYSLVR